MHQTVDGGNIFLGDSKSSANGTVQDTNHDDSNDDLATYELRVVKLDSGGAIQWQNLISGNMTENGRFIRQTTDGTDILLGYSASMQSGDVTGARHGMTPSTSGS